MEKLIFILIAFVFLTGILTSAGAVRLIWFFTGILFISDKVILLDSPTLLNFHRFLIYSLLLAELLNPKSLFKKLRGFPLIWPLAVVLTGMLCIGIFDSRNNIILNIYRSLDQFIQTFFVIFLCYANFKGNKTWRKLFNFFLIASILMGLFGLYVYVTKSNPYDNYIQNLFGSISEFKVYATDPDERFRINSFVSHPIYYGYLSGILLLLAFSHFLFKNDLKQVHLFAMVITFVNLIFSNSRTPLIGTFFGLLIFMVITLTKKLKVSILIYGFFVCLAIYNIPFVQQKINSSIDIFQTGGENTSGSSIDMRMEQLNASIKEYKKSPVVGNGIYYIKENLGFVNIQNNNSSSEFKGFESYIYELLIEQGAVGILVNCLFFFSLGRYFYKTIPISKHFAGLGLSITLMFLIFIIGTGPLGSWIITMGILGLLIGTLNYTANFNKLYLELFKGLVRANEG